MSANTTTIKFHPVWGLGFRPFFLLGSLASLILLALWVLFLAGRWQVLPYAHPVLWHAHEMIFGFTGAIIIGFLLTSTQNWTGLPGLKGHPLMALTLLWFAGRFLPFLGLPLALAALVDLAFFPAAIWALSPHLLHPEQKRNRVFFVLLSLFFGANLLTQLALTGIYSDLAPYGLRLALGVILMMILIITGRVVPFFTSRVIGDSKLKSYPWLEKVTLGGSAGFFLGYIFFPQSGYLMFAGGLIGLIHLLRWGAWHPEQSLKVPILAILYAGYFWIPVGFFCFAAQLFWPFNPSLGLHAWTVGAMGVIIYGMVSRVALGHTGRLIQASPSIVFGYLLMNLAATVRVFFPLIWSSLQLQWVLTSGLLWVLAFALLFKELAPILLKPRPDGKPG